MSKYLVIDARRYVFLDEKPDGHDWTEVELDYSDLNHHEFPEGADRPSPCLGRKRSHYKWFRTERDCESAGYEFLSREIFVFDNWAEYRQEHPE